MTIGTQLRNNPIVYSILKYLFESLVNAVFRLFLKKQPQTLIQWRFSFGKEIDFSLSRHNWLLTAFWTAGSPLKRASNPRQAVAIPKRFKIENIILILSVSRAKIILLRNCKKYIRKRLRRYQAKQEWFRTFNISLSLQINLRSLILTKDIIWLTEVGFFSADSWLYWRILLSYIFYLLNSSSAGNIHHSWNFCKRRIND